MNPRTICSFALCAFCWAVVIYRWNNLSGSVESRHTGILELPDEASPLPPSVPIGTASEHRSERRDSGTSAPPAQNSTDADAQRIITELVDHGLTHDEAHMAYKRGTEQARIERQTRPQMPGLRTNIDTNRWPLFE